MGVLTALTARRLLLTPGELEVICGRVGVEPPPGFAGPGIATDRLETRGLIARGRVQPSLAAGIAATCAPQAGVLVTALNAVTAAFGLRGELGGSLLRGERSDIEVSAWPALALADELARAVPDLGLSTQPLLRLPVQTLTSSCLQEHVTGRLQATVVAPPYVVGLVTWLATASGWLALEPADVVDGVRWATVRPVTPADLAPALAPLIAAALA